MPAKDFLSTKLFPLKRTDSVRAALEIMNESNVAFLPVVEKDKHLGYISASEIMDVKPASKKIDSYINNHVVSKVHEDQHVFEVIRVFAELNSSTVSVVDSNDHFIGIISARELIKHIANISAFKEPGSIITLQMPISDYSLTEIAKLVEYNNTKILSSYIDAGENNNNILVHLKLNTNELKSIISTFERYEYRIVASYFHEEDIKGLKSRYDLLMKYLDL